MATRRNSTIQGLSRVCGRGRCRGGAANVAGAERRLLGLGEKGRQWVDGSKWRRRRGGGGDDGSDGRRRRGRRGGSGWIDLKGGDDEVAAVMDLMGGGDGGEGAVAGLICRAPALG
ncbi:unnamed protein product [Triticum turgidum subsp. durum]|uniref:Uncharacterized protein n=1 Tax=Triticum turgidum subsp. durum TaxID=4567 RepID=A0A9R0THK0_TRITD|nr:unnamed protein product [Triticum turgidum subsp. durum]